MIHSVADRIVFDCNGSSIETTVGQLNFFKWAIDNLIIDYIKNNYNDIENDMNARIIPLDQSASR